LPVADVGVICWDELVGNWTGRVKKKLGLEMERIIRWD
jgi:hypothetical protein